MGRTFVNVTWSDASEVYDGAQQMNHFLKSGRANIRLYEDKPVEKKAKTVKSVDFRTKEEVAEDRLDAKRIKFEKAFEEGTIDFDRYNALLTEWEKARARLDRRMNILEEYKEVPSKPSSSQIMSIIEDTAKSFCSRHPFAFTVASILFGCGILNIAGIVG